MIMKKIINILLIVLIVAVMAACDDTAGGIDSFSNGTNGALASWVTSPDGDLILSNPDVGLAFEVEFIDENKGSTVEAWTFSVTDGDLAKGTVINQTSFSANSDGNQGFSGTITLADIASALGVTVASLEESDILTFSATLTRGGVVYPVGVASQFLDAVQSFEYTIATETTSLTSFTSKSTHLNAMSVDTIYLEFANDFTSELATKPTLSAISSGGNTYTFGEVKALLDKKEKDSVYWATITPPASIAEQDMVDIVISAAAAVAGFTMVNDTTSLVYIVDFIAPTVLEDGSSLKKGSGLDTLGHNFKYVFSEKIGSIKLTADVAGVDDDGDGNIDAADTDGDAVETTVETSGDILDYTYPWKGRKAEGEEVTLVLEVRDLAGNLLDVGTITVTLTL